MRLLWINRKISMTRFRNLSKPKFNGEREHAEGGNRERITCPSRLQKQLRHRENRSIGQGLCRVYFMVGMT